MKVAVVHNEPVAGRSDSEDVLEEVRLVTGCLTDLGHDFRVFSVGNNRGLSSLSESIFYLLLALRKYTPDVIFNLIEGFADNPVYQHYFSLIFEISGYPFTGSRHEAILSTTDKGLSKMIMRAFHIVTPPYMEYRGQKIKIVQPPPWIVKPALEDASIGIDDSSFFDDEARLMNYLPEMYRKYNGQPIIIEQFIDGREFNVSVLETGEGEVTILPPAEMIFHNWPSGKPRIVGYSAKWDASSFEYKNTRRNFIRDEEISTALKNMALRCWKIFNLSGYARVDMRVSSEGQIFVIDVNANPCIAPDSGFVAAAREAGFESRDVIREIIDTAAISGRKKKKSAAEQSS